MDENTQTTDLNKAQDILEQTLEEARQIAKNAGTSEETLDNVTKAVSSISENVSALVQEMRVNRENEENAQKYAELTETNVSKFIDDMSPSERAELIAKFGASNVALAVDKSELKKLINAPISKSAPNFEQVTNLRKAHDLTCIIAGLNGGFTTMKTGDGVTYDKEILKAAIRRIGESSLEDADLYAKAAGDAMDSITAGDGLEFLPVDLSADFIREFFLGLRVGALFPTVDMTSQVFNMPAFSGIPRGYLVGEATTPANFLQNLMTASSEDTYKLTFTARKLAVQSFWSGELEEDAIIAFAREVRSAALRGHVMTFEDALLNGARTNYSTTLDNFHTTAANKRWATVTGTSDARYAWDGIRKWREVLGTGTAVSGTGTAYAVSSMRQARGSLGKYGVYPSDLAWIVSPKGYVKMLGLTQVETYDKIRDRATILTGQLGEIDGIPIIVSENIPEDLNASGVYDNTTTNTTIHLLVNRDAYRIGTRRSMRVETDRSVIADQNVLVSTNRVDFVKVRPSAAEEAMVYNISY